MHQSAMKYGKNFFETYCAGDFSGKIIVDVGAQDVNGSLRQYCPTGAEYIGVDFVEGKGVDVIINDPYKLPFESNSVDVVVCSSVFEHSEFFWLLFLECVRIIKPTGLIYLNMPSNGMVHRYPVDSWRFYPDSGRALAKWARHNSYNSVLLESFIGEKKGEMLGEGMWNDCVAIILKDEKFASIYPRRLQDEGGEFNSGYDSRIETEFVRDEFLPDYRLLQQRQDTNEKLSSENLAQENIIREKEQEILRISSLLTQAVESANLLSSLNEKLKTDLSFILNSRSWYLTKPLRFFARTLRGESAKSFKPFVVKVLRAIWRLLPISQHNKASIKKLLLRKALNINSVIQKIPVIDFDDTTEEYVAYKVSPPINPTVKLIAFYLPQFHPFKENDEWWGKGFTEWTNVGKAEKNYIGHYQPHCPIHNGYYDLRVPSVMEEQAALAKQYGLYGFSYYFYWFAGKILMDTPLEMMLSNPKIDLPFCLTWANENWTRRWDGQENDILIAQDHSDEDSIAFIKHLLKYFNDSRYIKVDGKPVLIIYRASIIPEMAKTAKLWREEVKKHGIPDLYLICAQSFGIRGPEEFGFDASVEFPPHTIKSDEIGEKLEITNSNYQGKIYSYDQVVASAIRQKEPEYKLFRTPMLSWDNTARKQHHGHIFHGFSLLRYKQWLSSVCNNVAHSEKYNSDEKFVFINAWNEWAEGTHLEPDRKYGYGYLQATYDVVSDFDAKYLPKNLELLTARKNDYAVVLHVHYVALWPEIKKYLHSLETIGFDLFVTVTNRDVVGVILSDYPEAFVSIHENRGRDIYPFIETLKSIVDHGYTAVCKLHTKRSVYRTDGDDIRTALFNSLLGSEAVVKEIVDGFNMDLNLGLVVPNDSLISHTDHNMTFDHQVVKEASGIVGIEFRYDAFPAGSMFWFRPSALNKLLSFDASDFDIEQGLADGTLPHAIERIICLIVKDSGFGVKSC